MSTTEIEAEDRLNGNESIQNKTMIQYFEWYIPNDSKHWMRTVKDAPHLAALGFTDVWLPPAYKGQAGVDDVGYGVYDTYDLGEFDQKGTVATKYGTKAELIQAVDAIHNNHMRVFADIVLNHRMGADNKEEIPAEKCQGWNRNKTEGKVKPIIAWTKFTFPGRNNKYSDFQWDWHCFSGIDWDEKNREHAIFLFKGKQWDEHVDKENGNFDYLMGCDLDMDYPRVIDELDRWGKWYQETIGYDAVRLDAVKHINFHFFTHWLQTLRKSTGLPIPAVGEYWQKDINALVHYLDESGLVMRVFDVSLHYRFQDLSNSNGQMDISKLFEGTLMDQRPDQAVTFVDNHDTQPTQALESWVQDWCKPLAYSCILLRKEGLPCVFYGDLYGIPHDNKNPVLGLDILLLSRKYAAYGSQTDYFNSPNQIGWTRIGDEKFENSGCAVVLTNGPDGEKQMCVGATHAGQIFIDVMQSRKEEILIPDNGVATFPFNGGGVSVWMSKPLAEKIRKEAAELYEGTEEMRREDAQRWEDQLKRDEQARIARLAEHPIELAKEKSELALKAQDEAKRKAEEAQKAQEEAARKVEEAKKAAEEAQRFAEEAKKAEEEAQKAKEQILSESSENSGHQSGNQQGNPQ